VSTGRMRPFSGLSVLRPRRSDRPAPEDPWAHGRPLSRSRALAGLVWLGFIVAPLIDAIGHGGHGAGYALTIAAAAAFAVFYVWLVFIWIDDRRRWRAWALSELLAALAIALTIFSRSSWGYLFSYVAACTALTVPSGWSFPAVLVTAAVGAGAGVLGGGSAGEAAGYAISTIGVGLLLTLMRDLRTRNLELTEARAELARTAVAAERERFARDLHDLLGHTLSVITIKAELAGRLLPLRPADAAAEIADVEQVARQALGEVRDAVSGYRQPTLAGEMEGARMALSAAGIIAEFERSPVKLDPDVEAVLAWAVREGATNVIRHSRASRCQVRVLTGLADAAVEVVDDGRGPTVADDDLGHGLAGLTERAESLRGRMEAGALPGGGFRLSVSIPVSVATP
jgi:two-component system, NarL family, sensor histidine kinase DesK